MGASRVAALAGFLGAAVSAAAAGGCEGCDGGGFADAGLPDAPAPGTLSLTWTVTDSNGQPLPCDRIGAQAVVVSVRNAGAAVGETAVFACASGTGTTQAFPPGTYVVDFELTDVTGPIAMAPRQPGVVVVTGRDTALGPQTFMVDAVGGLDLFLKASGTMSNCGPLNQMGAAWSGVTIALERPGGACEPATITIAPGATRPGGTYTASCTAPVVAPCIESDQRLTATGLPSDAYTIRVRGRVGALECWANDDPIRIPALGRVFTGTLNLAKNTTPGC